MAPGNQLQPDSLDKDHVHRLWGRDHRGILDHAEKLGLSTREHEFVQRR